jgi:hypothetical protein
VKALGGISLAAVCVALSVAPVAQAHRLTAKKAEAALQPAAEQMAPQVAAKLATLLPGATIADTSVNCTVRKKKEHQAICSIDFAIAGATTGETACSIPARVKFRSKSSKELKTSIAPASVCLFFVELE